MARFQKFPKIPDSLTPNLTERARRTRPSVRNLYPYCCNAVIRCPTSFSRMVGSLPLRQGGNQRVCLCTSSHLSFFPC